MQLIKKDIHFKKVLPFTLHTNLQKIVLPQGITLEDLVVISSIIHKYSTEKKRQKIDTDFISISKTMFENAVGERKIGNKKLYSIALTLLDDAGIIKINACGRKDSGSNEFMINYDQYDLFVNMMVVIKIENPYLNKKTKEIINKSDEDLIKKKLIKMNSKSLSNFKNLKIDYDRAMDYLKYVYDNQIPYKGKIMTNRVMQQIESILKYLNEGERNISVCQTNGRVDTDITNLRSDFRQFIIGEDLHILDISNSQPLLMSLLIDMLQNPLNNESLQKYIYNLLKNAYGYKTKKDIAKELLIKLSVIAPPNQKELNTYKQITENGTFYEYFQDWYQNNKYDTYDKKNLNIRDNMKDMVFSIFYDKHDNETLQLVFPSINKYLNSIKKVFIDISHNLNIYEKEARLFAIVMQGIESFIWIQLIQPLLSESNIMYYGIHDCVIIKKTDMELAESKIKYVYNIFNLNPKIKPEHIAKKSLLNKDTKVEIKKSRVGIDFLNKPKKEVDEIKINKISTVYNEDLFRKLEDKPDIKDIFDNWFKK